MPKIYYLEGCFKLCFHLINYRYIFIDNLSVINIGRNN